MTIQLFSLMESLNSNGFSPLSQYSIHCVCVRLAIISKRLLMRVMRYWSKVGIFRFEVTAFDLDLYLLRTPFGTWLALTNNPRSLLLYPSEAKATISAQSHLISNKIHFNKPFFWSQQEWPAFRSRVPTKITNVRQRSRHGGRSFSWHGHLII